MLLTNKTYNSLKLIALVTFPCLSVLCFVSSYIWDLPSTKFILGMNAMVSFVLGVWLILSSSVYERSNTNYDGNMYVIIPEDGPKVFTLELNGDPEELTQQDSITFKVLPRREL